MDLPPWAAGLLLALFLALSAYGAALTTGLAATAETATVDLTDTDLALYQAVAARVGTGDSYYQAVVAEHRERGYPLKPVFTVRLPGLAWVIGGLGPDYAALLLRLLAFASLVALVVRLRSIAASRFVWGATAISGAAATILLTVPAMTYWHESWAALLILVSLAARTEKSWLPSVLLALAAVLIRELALPYLCLMAALAWREGNRREALAWGGAVLLFLAALAAHASVLSPLVTGADGASPGWTSVGGWPFVLALAQRCTVFLFLPLPVVALLVPLALLGWAGVRHPLADRAALLLLGYFALFTIVGRPDNFYWGILIAPLLPIGLAFAPLALRDLARSLSNLNPGARTPAG